MSDFYCPAPWHVGFYTHQEQSVCCAYTAQQNTTPLKYIASDEVKEIKRNLLSGTQIGTCKNYCQLQEQRGLTSLRQQYIEFPLFPGEFDRNINSTPMPRRIEVRLSNLCNFSCRMCSPKWSSNISKEIKIHPHLKQYYTDLDVEVHEEDYAETVEDIKKIIPHLHYLTFTGGEPTITKPVLELIDYIIDNGYTEQITLHIVTNTSVINQNILSKLEKFAKGQITLSLDGIGAVAEYQRFGTRWEQVYNNIVSIGTLVDRMNGKYEANVNITLTAYNVLRFAEFMKFYKMLFEEYNFSVNMTVTTSPTFLNVFVLPEHLRAIAKSELSLSLEILEDIDFKTLAINTLIEQLKSCLEQFDTIQVEQQIQNKFVEYTQELDRARNQSFFDVFNVPLVA